jgi:RNA polymerase sigma-70 factor (ECF subfamily)
MRSQRSWILTNTPKPPIIFGDTAIRAYYSLDRGDGIEHDILFVSLSPYEIYERKVTIEQLHAAVATLPDKQAKRIYAHILGVSQANIARVEGVDARNIRKSINKGLRNMEVFLKNYC